MDDHRHAGENMTATCTRATILEAAKKLDRIQKDAAHHMACFGSVMTRIVIDEYLSPPVLKWWETVLTWNPCNTFVNQEHVVYMMPNMTIVSPECWNELKRHPSWN